MNDPQSAVWLAARQLYDDYLASLFRLEIEFVEHTAQAMDLIEKTAES